MKTRISSQLRNHDREVEAADQSPTVDALNKALANLMVFSQLSHHYHWNTVGDGNFFDLHDVFGKIYDMLNDDIDEFAERVRQLRNTPLHTLADMIAAADIEEDPSLPDDKTMVQNIIAAFDKLIASFGVVVEAATAAGDRPSVFLVDTKVGGYQKQQWFLRSFIGER